MSQHDNVVNLLEYKQNKIKKERENGVSEYIREQQEDGDLVRRSLLSTFFELKLDFFNLILEKLPLTVHNQLGILEGTFTSQDGRDQRSLALGFWVSVPHMNEHGVTVMEHLSPFITLTEEDVPAKLNVDLEEERIKLSEHLSLIKDKLGSGNWYLSCFVYPLLEKLLSDDQIAFKVVEDQLFNIVLLVRSKYKLGPVEFKITYHPSQKVPQETL